MWEKQREGKKLVARLPASENILNPGFYSIAGRHSRLNIVL